MGDYYMGGYPRLGGYPIPQHMTIHYDLRHPSRCILTHTPLKHQLRDDFF